MFHLFFNTENFDFSFKFYYWSFLMMMVLLLVSLMVILYNYYYMLNESFFKSFLMVLLLFIFSMIILIFSSTPIMILTGWDMLGLTSMLLVMHYMSWDSIMGATITFMTMRFGDFFLILSLMFLLGQKVNVYNIQNSFLVFSLLMLALLTKSAQFPFMTWLPRAMSAPTPVSSLVHSSTLVTSGLIMVMLIPNNFYNNILLLVMFLSLLSFLLSGLMGVAEEDYKKLIALSTLSQISFCFMIMLLGCMIIMYSHLLTHAFIKSCLFMQVGYLIYTSLAQQESRFLNYRVYSFFTHSILCYMLFCLMGLFYSSGTVSKELIISNTMNSMNSMMLLIYLMGVLMTFFYCWRIWFCSFNITMFGPYYVKINVQSFFFLIYLLFSIFFSYFFMYNYTIVILILESVGSTASLYYTLISMMILFLFFIKLYVLKMFLKSSFLITFFTDLLSIVTPSLVYFESFFNLNILNFLNLMMSTSILVVMNNLVLQAPFIFLSVMLLLVLL